MPSYKMRGQSMYPALAQYRQMDDHTIAGALGELAAVDPAAAKAYQVALLLANTLQGGFAAYHGYKRHHESLLWGLGWWIFGGSIPVLPTALMLAQGFGKPMKGR